MHSDLLYAVLALSCGRGSTKCQCCITVHSGHGCCLLYSCACCLLEERASKFQGPYLFNKGLLFTHSKTLSLFTEKFSVHISDQTHKSFGYRVTFWIYHGFRQDHVILAFYSPFQLQITSSVRERLLWVTWTLLLWPS